MQVAARVTYFSAFILISFAGDKSLVRWYRGYLIVVCEPSKTAGRPFAGARSLSIYDIQNQFIAYQGRFDDLITDILCEWGSLFVLFKTGRLIRLDELDTKTKLEMLFKKNLYHTAIRYCITYCIISST